MDIYSLSYTHTMTITTDKWQDMDEVLICPNHTIAATAIASIPSTVTPTTVAATQIEDMSFLKYVNVVLLDKSQFQNFCDNFVSQSTRHKLKI